MPRLKNLVPRYCLHKASGQATVSFNGVDHYLGPHGTEVSRNEYDRLIGEYLSSKRNAGIVNRGFDTSVGDILKAFRDFAADFYLKNGKPTSELFAYKRVIRTVARMYAEIAATEFGPLALKAIRDSWVRDGLSRSTCNKNQRRVVRIFKWGVGEELIGPQCWQSLSAVEGLRKGRTTAAEKKPIPPVALDKVQLTIPHLSPVVADMIRMQLLTGMRPGEVCSLRPCDLDRTEDVWEYTPQSHKTEHHERGRTVYIGPQAKVILLPYLLRAPDMNCFSAAESREWFRVQRAANRTTPASCGNRRGKKSQPNKPAKQARYPRTCFDTSSYGQAIAYACQKAWPAPESGDAVKSKAWEAAHRWAPNQIRHTRATEIRKQFGLEAAQVILGHASADVTQIYAERDAEKAREVIRQIG